jgi:Cu+-exporting ATPase
MTCAACAARVERKLNKLPGVQASVSYATDRAQVCCAEDTAPTMLIKQVRDGGYVARRVDDVAPVDDGADRLAVAAVLAVPLCDLSLALSLFPKLRFAGWQWVCLVLGAPVVACQALRRRGHARAAGSGRQGRRGDSAGRSTPDSGRRAGGGRRVRGPPRGEDRHRRGAAGGRIRTGRQHADRRADPA